VVAENPVLLAFFVLLPRKARKASLACQRKARCGDSRPPL
jgi:hypothetical protein